jgi:hypothetical protein
MSAIDQVVVPLKGIDGAEGLAGGLARSLGFLCKLLLVIENGLPLVGNPTGPISCSYAAQEYVTYLKAVADTLREAMADGRGEDAHDEN